MRDGFVSDLLSADPIASVTTSSTYAQILQENRHGRWHTNGNMIMVIWGLSRFKVSKCMQISRILQPEMRVNHLFDKHKPHAIQGTLRRAWISGIAKKFFGTKLSLIMPTKVDDTPTRSRVHHEFISLSGNTLPNQQLSQIFPSFGCWPNWRSFRSAGVQKTLIYWNANYPH